MLTRQSIAFSYATFFAVLGIFAPYLAPLLHAYGFNYASIGFISSFGSLCTILVPMIMGRLIDLGLSFHRTLMCIAGIWCASSAVLATTQSHLLVALALFAFFVVRAPVTPLHDTAAMRVCDYDAGRYAMLRIVGSVGFAVSAASFGFLFPEPSARHIGVALLCYALLAFGVAVVFPIRLPATALPTQQPIFWRTISGPQWIWLLTMALHWTTFGPFHYGYSLFVTEVGVSAKWAGVYWGVGVLAEIVALASCKWLLRWFSSHHLLQAAFVITLVRWLISGWYPSPTMLLLMQLLHGPGFAWFYAAAQQQMTAFKSHAYPASLQGLFTTCAIGMGSALGMIAGGWLHQSMPFAHVLLWMVPVECMALGLLLLNKKPLEA